MCWQTMAGDASVHPPGINTRHDVQQRIENIFSELCCNVAIDRAMLATRLSIKRHQGPEGTTTWVRAYSMRLSGSLRI